MNNSLPTALCITRKDQEQLLITELRSRAVVPQCTQVAPQAVEISSVSLQELTQTPLFFSAQLLPAPVRIEATSITQWAQQLFTLLTTSLGEPAHRWMLHIFDPLSAETGKHYARPERVREALLELLKQRRRSLLRALSDTPDENTTFVQVALVAATHGYLSVAATPTQHQCRAALSSSFAGYLDVPDDKAPPSRAFKKLREAMSRFSLSLERGETAVDLGATPGGWTYVLLQEGLTVTAIDRSPLDTTLMHKRGIDWIQGNAFTWRPPKAVDWLVCDVITTPENTLSILKQWITGRWCKKFCVTVKFKGAPDISTLARITEFLSSSTTWFDGKQLTHNKNEVTVVGAVSL